MAMQNTLFSMARSTAPLMEQFWSRRCFENDAVVLPACDSCAVLLGYVHQRPEGAWDGSRGHSMSKLTFWSRAARALQRSRSVTFSAKRDASPTSPEPKTPGAIFDARFYVRADYTTVLDPFCGSGTTLVAARHLGRRALGSQSKSDAGRSQRHTSRSSNSPPMCR